MPVLFGGALFLSAALMFCLQPMIGRMLLPLVGGTPAGWVVALAFFQAALLAGYFLAYLLGRFSPRVQAGAYIAVLVSGATALPVALAAPAALTPEAVFALLCVAAGAPFVALSASASTLQRLFAAAQARDPYFLYAASNLGSFVGLFAYVFLFDGHVGLKVQAAAWTAGYAALIVLAVLCLAAAGRSVEIAKPSLRIGMKRRLEWVALAFFPSALVLAVTAHMTTDIAAVPLLWVLPLGLYLLTFVAAFARDGRHGWAAALQPFLAAAALVLAVLEPHAGVLPNSSFLSSYTAPVGVIAGLCALHLLAFGTAALACHTRLAALRPAEDASRLTEFYLMIALGGALGGAFVAFAAPLLFDHPLEYPLLLAAACFIVPGRVWARVLVVAVLAGALGGDAYLSKIHDTAYARNFYGALKVYDRTGPRGVVRLMQSGASTYGFERRVPGGAALAMKDYDPRGVVNDALAAAAPQHIAVVGLGAGILDCLAAPGRDVTFFEINPTVSESARRDFDYFTACGTPRIIEGDARLEMQKPDAGSFDLIIMDAFLSGMVPTHLLTREAIATYLDRLTPRGIILFHLVNRYFDLDRPLVAAAREMGLSVRLVHGDFPFPGAALWVAMARDEATLAALPPATWSAAAGDAGVAWTDDKTDTLSAMRFWK